jgi:hypothetical protein
MPNRELEVKKIGNVATKFVTRCISSRRDEYLSNARRLLGALQSVISKTAKLTEKYIPVYDIVTFWRLTPLINYGIRLMIGFINNQLHTLT